MSNILAGNTNSYHTYGLDDALNGIAKAGFKYVELFNTKFPDVVLVLKGANTIIAQHNTFYINPHGSSVLAKGGSGDILTGICGALLAQRYSPLEAAVQASLAQSFSAKSVEKNSYALTPDDIIQGLAHL